MDISKYRDNIELSDVCVVVDDHEYNLHKFPLSINSEYFKDQCKSESKIVLNDFPGRWRTFEFIADHCYGKEVNINHENVVLLLCSAIFLGMNGKNNLIEKCQKFVDRTFRSVEYSKSVEMMFPMLDSTTGLTESKVKEIIERGLSVMVDLWLRRKVNYKPNFKEGFFEDMMVFEELMKLNPVWIELVLEYCSTDENKHPFIGRLAVQYIKINIIDKMDLIKEQSSENDHRKVAEGRPRKRTHNDSNSSSLNEIPRSESGSSCCDKEVDKSIRTQKEDSLKESIGELLDRIVFALPDNINLGKTVSVHWLQKCFEIYNKYRSKSKNKLLKLCGGMLVHLPIGDIKSMDPKTVTEMIEEVLKDEKVDKDIMKWIWDNNFLEMAKNDELDPSVFSKVVKNMPESEDVDPDVVFQIVLSTLNKLSGDMKTCEDELIECVHLDQISPENLEAALESKFWKAEDICKVAINRLKIVKEDSKLDRKKYEPYSTRYNSYEDSSNEQIGRYSFGNKNISGWKSQSFVNNEGDDEDYCMKSYEPVTSYCPSYKYVHGNYPLDSYLTLEENLKWELKKISDSYITYYKDRFPLKERRRFQCSMRYDV